MHCIIISLLFMFAWTGFRVSETPPSQDDFTYSIISLHQAPVEELLLLKKKSEFRIKFLSLFIFDFFGGHHFIILTIINQIKIHVFSHSFIFHKTDWTSTMR